MHCRLQALMLRGEAELGEPWARQLALGLGLAFLGRQGAIEATLEVLRYAACSFSLLARSHVAGLEAISPMLQLCNPLVPVVWEACHSSFSCGLPAAARDRPAPARCSSCSGWAC